MTAKPGKFLPVPNPVTLPYWEACKRHELLIQQCSACGAQQFYPRSICVTCQATELEWLQASGSGTVVSWTVVRHPVSPAYADDIPFVIALVELDEGPRMMSRIVDCDPETMQSGLLVDVCFEQRTDEITLPNFRCRDGQQAGPA